MHKILHFVFYASFSILCGCKVQKPITNQVAYSQDLTQYRLAFEAKEQGISNYEVTEHQVLKGSELPKNAETEQINDLIDQLADTYKQIKKTNGYRIQFYSGLSLDDAQEMQKKVRLKLSKGIKDKVFILYTQPYYKVKMGNYVSRLEAYTVVKEVQKDFSNANVISDVISLSKLREKYTKQEDEEEE